MQSKSFYKLLEYLKEQKSEEIELTTEQVENIIQEDFPASARNHSAWWKSSGPDDHYHIYILNSESWFAKPNASTNITKVLFTKNNNYKKNESNKKRVTKTRKQQKRDDIPTPCPDEVNKYLEKWNNLGAYVIQEEALDDLFMKTYPKNTDIKQVIIKASALNDFYSTNIFKIYPVAQRIIELRIDERLEKNDINLVNDIANVKVSEQTDSTKEKYINFYSFATKYCSRHKPTEYPIFDSYVEKMLKYYRDIDNKISFNNSELKKYNRYKEILLDFRQKYNLESFNLKQIDKYLWQLGKEKFPNNYKKKKKDE